MIPQLILAYRTYKTLNWIYKTAKDLFKEDDKIKAKLKKKDVDKALNAMASATTVKERLEACKECEKLLKKKCSCNPVPPAA